MIDHPTWSQIMGDTRAGRRRERRLHAQSVMLAVTAALCALFATGLRAWPKLAQQANDVGFAAQAAKAAETASTSDDLSQARAYNRQLVENGQRIGAEVDPFTGAVADQDGRGDVEYEALMNGTSDGVMGAIRIPSISVDLPIRHGSGSDVLGKGAGHLHGTSLPIGGVSTRTVITAHRGLADMLLFTRLDELHDGDLFEIDNVYGQKLKYRVIRVEVVDPDQVDRLAIEPGRDLATLLTCTPYGVNTQRLLVTGERVDDSTSMRGQVDPRRAGAPAVGLAAGVAAAGMPVAYRSGWSLPPVRHRAPIRRRRRHA